MAAIDRRALEVAIVDALRRQGCPLHYRHGIAFALAEFRDEKTGDLLLRQRLVDVEKLARDLAEALR
jgi:hypothetical protein